MALLTKNLFRGGGEGSWRLEVVEGNWPSDAYGNVFIIGPDKREPGGHWFGEWGLLHRFAMEPGADGTLRADARRMSTRIERLSRRFPRLFGRIEFAEVSPFGVSNMANTNVQAIDGRLFVGYDAGRPVEVDPVTMEVITPVGSNSEWQQLMPGLLEPLVPVAAHPAPSWEERAVYFVNWSPLPGQDTWVARWALNGPVERWRVEGMPAYDSIHDIKATRNHLVFCDLPFKVDPERTRTGAPRVEPNQDFTQLWIVAKDDLRRIPPGGSVRAMEVHIPFATGHIMVDVDDDDGVLRVHNEHIALADLMITHTAGDTTHSGAVVAPEHEGLISLTVQPGCVGTHEIDLRTGELTSSDVIWDDRFWGGVLSTYDYSSAESRERVTQAWYGGMGYDPDLVSEEWYQLYRDSGKAHLVAPDDLPATARPGALAHFDLESKKLTGLYEYTDGSFPAPPTFVPRRGSEGPNDGYVVVLVHADAGKEIHIFDAQHVDDGPLARATVAGFNPPLLLHSYWMDHREGPRPSTYRVPLRKDVAGALRGIPGTVVRGVRSGRAMAREMRAGARPTGTS